MAYFYKHIKGLNASEVTHHITWSSVQSVPESNERFQSYLPSFSIKNQDAENDYGKFLISGTQDDFEWFQTIYSNFLINNRSFCFEDTKHSDKIYTLINATHIQTPKISAPSRGSGISGNYSSVGPSSAIVDFTIKPGGIVLSTIENVQSIYVKSDGNIEFNGNVQLPGELNLQLQGGDLQLDEGNITAIQGYCEAVYFNAKSDKRAKTNIKPISISALDYINSIPVYSFNYKNNYKPSIGIMAQDVLDKPVGDLNFVENQEATGENNDFMSIKESKLVYVLWKAVQELSEEVKTLKEQLNKKVL